MRLYQQHLLFYLPYVSIALTGILLLLLASSSSSTTTTSSRNTNRGGRAILSQLVVGYGNVLLICLYLSKVIGNHYVKVYAIAFNFVALLVLLPFYWLFTATSSSNSEGDAIIVIATTFLIPTIVYLIATITVPSASVIVPNQLLLGNCTAATSVDIIRRYKITHITF